MSWSDNIEGYKCSPDNSAELAKGWIIKGENIRDLATKIGRDPDALEATVKKWNEDCAAGKDTQFDIGDPASYRMKDRKCAWYLSSAGHSTQYRSFPVLSIRREA